MAARQSAQASDCPSHRSCCGQDGRAPEVGRADPVFRLGSGFPRSYEPGYKQRPRVGRARSPWRGPRDDKRLGRSAPLRGAVRTARWWWDYGRAGCRAQFGLHHTQEGAEVVPPTTSGLIVEAQRRRVKVGRAVHCAPGLVMQTGLLGWNTALRALTSAATSRWPVFWGRIRKRCRRSLRLGLPPHSKISRRILYRGNAEKR